MINSKQIDSEDEDDKFFQHKVLPTKNDKSKIQSDSTSNQTYPSIPPNMQNHSPLQNHHHNNQQNNIQFQKPNYQYNPQGYNNQYNQGPQYNQHPNFSAPYGQNSYDQPLTPNMYNSFGMANNQRYSMPQQPNFQNTDVSLHDFNRKGSYPNNNYQGYNNGPY